MNQEIPEKMRPIVAMDKSLRKQIAEYFMLLQQMNDPARAVDMLAEHVAIMVAMIEDFKK